MKQKAIIVNSRNNVVVPNGVYDLSFNLVNQNVTVAKGVNAFQDVGLVKIIFSPN